MKNIINILIFVAIGIAFQSCSSSKENETNDKKFSLTENMLKSIKLDTARFEDVQNELKLTGKISFDDEKVIKIFPLISGTVSEVKVGIGDYVEKGQTIAIIRSSEMAGMENDLNTAQANVEIAQKNLNSTEDMFKGGIASEKDFLTAQKDLSKAKSELNKVRNTLKSFGSESKSDYIVKAPISGVVVEKFINPSMQIRPDNNNNIFTISDLKDVWVMANVFETDISRIKEGYEVDVTTLSYPDKILKGKVDKIYNVLDPVSKVMKVRIKLSNIDYQLKPEMFANVTVHYSEGISKVAIPSKAIIFDKSKNYVIVFKDKKNLETREVTIYKALNNITYIESGLNKDEKVISNNQLLVYNELND